MESKIIIGLVGFRCCGKSTLRLIVNELGYSIFDTNSVKTGDPDANQISISEILKRYGQSASYLNYLENSIKAYYAKASNILFIDSLKVKTDLPTLKKMFPSSVIKIWYLHAPIQVRKERYQKRDIDTNFRTQDLLEHDLSLEKHGIWELIKNAEEVINTNCSIQDIKIQIEKALKKYNHTENNA